MSAEQIELYSIREQLTSPGRRYLYQLVNGRLAVGELTVITPRKARRKFEGAMAGPAADIHLVRPLRLALRVLMRGDVGFAEGFVAGDWRSSDLTLALELLSRNEEYFIAKTRGNLLTRITKRLKHSLRANSRVGSRRNIACHYDLGNAFYRLWLDAGMTYSCALFAHPHESLEAAQTRKYERMLGILRPRAGAHILEIGCGWGGFALVAARAGLRVTGITLSEAQLRLARRRVAEAGLEERVELRLQDYRDVTERFDHIVSIEMLEAVGEAYWPTFFETLARRLKPGGRVALQCITIDEAYFATYRNSPDFIQLYVFPGGMLPSPEALASCAARVGFQIRERNFFGSHYATTIERWQRRVTKNAARIRALGYEERFIRLWLYYLAYCAAGFETGRVNVAQFLLQPSATTEGAQ